MINIKSRSHHFLYSCLFIFISCLCYGQSATVQARIIDDKTQEPLPFATIKLMKDKAVVSGLVSNAEGDFQFPASYLSSIDAIVISSIGYVSKIILTSQLSVDHLNVIRIKESTTQLKEVVVTPHKQPKLTASKIVRLAINAISKNYPQHPYSYTAYYRDYQKEGKEYVNMNEAAVGVFDNGFSSNDYQDTQIKLYQYKSNGDFKKDPLAAIPYNDIDGSKVIPSAKVGSFGGNELSLLRIHDAIRNHEVQTYSYANIFDTDFTKNHSFKLVDTVYRDNIPLYHITFQSFYFASGKDFDAKGEIFIEQDNYAIHKLIYSNYMKEVHGESLLYNIQLEYVRKKELMYLNYISFNNLFKAKVPNLLFKAISATYNIELNAFIVTFNRIPEKSSALNTKNYSFTFNKKSFIINRIELSPSSKNVATVYVDNGRDFDWNQPASVLSQKLNVSFNNIKDLNDNFIVHALNETQYDYKTMNQFRELFVQKVDEAEPKFKGPFAFKNIPLNTNIIDNSEPDVLFWSNTPLKNLFESNAKQQGTKSNEDSTSNNFLRIQEKVYVQTDKPYYYPGEKLWFSAYMNYRDSAISDSLSRVLYVELLNDKGEIKDSKTVRIDDRTGFGNFSITDSTKTGVYFLRAYTNWILNYPKEEIFMKPFKVLNVYQRPENTLMEKEDSTTLIKLKTDKQKYKPRDEIKLQAELCDENGKPITGSLSVSVTDMNQVVPLPHEKNILTDYTFKEKIKQSPVDSLNPIERGITLNGNYLDKNAKPIATELMLVVSNKKEVKDYFSVFSNEEGEIWYNGFRFYDSAEIGLKERGKNKHEGKIKLIARKKPEFHFPKNDWSYSVINQTAHQRPELLETGNINGTLLKDVIVKATRHKDRLEDPIYGMVDYSISSDDLSSFFNISDALKSRVPGLGSSGFIRPTSFTKGGDIPILIIDGVRMNGMSIAEFNKNYSPNMIERINVFKNGGSIFGASGATGVIVVYTKTASSTQEKKEQTKIDLTSFQTFTVNGFSSADQFSSPDYSTNIADNGHDYRSTIFWSPHIVPDQQTGAATLSFYAADSPALYRIVVEGVTSKFVPVRNVIYVEVIK